LLAFAHGRKKESTFAVEEILDREIGPKTRETNLLFERGSKAHLQGLPWSMGFAKRCRRGGSGLGAE